jgi:hypothetical protein
MRLRLDYKLGWLDQINLVIPSNLQSKLMRLR